MSIEEKASTLGGITGASSGDLSKLDCSSFTAQMFKENGITLPRVISDQAKTGTTVSGSNLQKGDLVFYDTDYDGVVNHVGIYADSNKMINAVASKGVSYFVKPQTINKQIANCK
ncbi:C40 family peptidase [Priestia megaterium]|uniref:C40 family peptidase n=1 Tax=Priestia megaterium TaxID=1404 RepID=UPI002E20E9F8|nr:C40 family peptidase [Priestia megaterium]MED4292199.1 C40 family peptidase [Priestia megaterium]MED4298027.1 C40 family peptidase [Priestia megaterium]